MSTSKSHTASKHLALLLAFAYFFCALSYIFFMPTRTTATSVVSVLPAFSVRRPDRLNGHEAINFVRVIDRSIIDDDQYHSAKCLPMVLLLVFTGLSLFRVTLRLPLPLLNIFYNHRYHYLSLCTFRI